MGIECLGLGSKLGWRYIHSDNEKVELVCTCNTENLQTVDHQGNGVLTGLAEGEDQYNDGGI